MELTARQFAEMVNHLKGPSRFGGTSDQRRAPRTERQARIAIVPIADGQPRTPVNVDVKNVSSRGLGFVHDRKLKAGSQFLVNLAPQGSDAVEMLCTVVHCDAARKGVYAVGAEFTCLAPTAAAGAGDAASSEPIQETMLE
jgi:hypothetical protein